MDNDLRGQIDALNRQAWAIFRHDPPRAQALSQAALAQASQAQPPYLQGVLESRRTLSQVCVGRGDYPQALAHAEAGMQLVAAEALDAAPTAVRHAWLMAAHGRAMALNYLQGAQDSLVQLYENLALAERLGDTLAQAVALNGIASDRHHLGELDEARALYARCLALLQSLDEPFWEALARYNVGALCEDRQEYAEGLQYVLQALQLAERLDDTLGQAVALNGLASNHHHLGNLDEARALYARCLALLQPLDEPFWEALARYNVGALCEDRQEYA
ncbi:MAG: tetratricopeptide repeat protein, partial [Anaerolineales bacterium]|nr:tetratricopeptide repeat protein [Anaerolineales bacterium]